MMYRSFVRMCTNARPRLAADRAEADPAEVFWDRLLSAMKTVPPRTPQQTRRPANRKAGCEDQHPQSSAHQDATTPS